MAYIQFPSALFGPGSFSATIVDNNGLPAEVLEASAPFRIRVNWDVGPLAALLLGGQWEVAAYVESIGPGPEKVLATTTLAVTGAQVYSATLTVPAGTLPNDPPAAVSAGVYKIVTVLTHRNFTLITNIAAVAEGPVVRIA
jgi:hypothetical protein